MKSNKFSLSVLFSLPVIAVCVLFTSCENFFMPESKIVKATQIYTSPSLSRTAELALWHTAESHETPVETLQDQVQAWLQPETDNESRSRSTVTGVYSYSVTVENGFSSVPANRRNPNSAPERSIIPFYVFQLENREEGTSGFAFTCGDPRIGDLLALVENGDFHDIEMPFWQIFLGCLNEYIEETIAIYNSISDYDIDTALSVSNTGENRSINLPTFDQLPDRVELNVVTRWYQSGDAYNLIINDIAGRKTPIPFWPAGCGAVAMGQIMAYHEWPPKPPSTIRIPSDDHLNVYLLLGTYINNFYDPITQENVRFSNITYDWEEMKKKPNADALDKEVHRMHVGVLMLAIGHKINMVYGISGSSASSSFVINGFKDFGYNIGSDTVSYNFELVKNMLKENKPVMMEGYSNLNYDGGHYWIIDGYMSTSSADYVRCNPGWWGEKGFGWYKSGVFNMNSPIKTPHGTINPRSVEEKYYRYYLSIFTDIYPNNNQVITISEIDGIHMPVTGFVPRPDLDTVIYITETEQFTGTVKWLVPTGTGVLKEIGVNIPFEAGIEYTAEITLAPKKGLTFQGLEADFFTVTNAASTSNLVDSGLISAVFSQPLNYFASGNGISGKPFIINTVEEFNILRHYSDAHFKLGNNIDLQNIPWTPISEFRGTLDGNSKIISNLNMTFTDGLSGNFKHTDRISFGLIAFNKGTVRNLAVTANINLTNIPSNYTLPANKEIVVGVIAAGNDGTIQNVTVSSSNTNPMINAEIHKGNVVGGITGYNYGWVTSCINNGIIHTSLTTGGITGCNIGATNNGENNALIRYIYNNMDNAIGGIVGSNLMGLVQNGTNNGTITYANSSSASHLIQPAMGHIAGWKAADTEVGGVLNFSGGTMNLGTLQTVTYTSGGVSQTHNQALYAGNRAVGMGFAGTGTAGDPFLVITEENLRRIKYSISDFHYRLMNNIDLQNIPWTPLEYFYGVFEGNNFTISNLNMTFTDSFLVNNRTISYGFIAENRGIIRNLRVTANINLTNIPSNYNLPQNGEIAVGVIAAENYGTIQNVTVSSSDSNPMINSIVHVKNITGGVSGKNYASGRITNCKNNGVIHSSGDTGGIIGNNLGTSNGCENNALIRYTYINENRGIGGIIGQNSSGSVTSGTNKGTIFYANTDTSTNNSVQPYMAHIVGYRANGTVSGTFTYSAGTVNSGSLQIVTVTLGGISQTHDQTVFVGNRVIGKEHISGSGVASDPYIIDTVTNFNYIRQFPNATFKLTNNIDLSLLGTWTPIPEFTGVIEGNNKTLSNLQMTFNHGLSGNYYHTDRISFGLIAFNKGTVRNLTVTANINLTNIPGNYTLPANKEIVVGVIAAGNDGTIQNCTVSASSSNPMINATIHTGNIVGGITGYNYGKVTSCINNGDIHTSLTTGGITGCNIGLTTSGTNNALIRYTYKNMENAIGGTVGVNLLGLVQGGTNNGTITYTNSSSTSLLIQPCMGHIVGSTTADSEVIGTLSFSGGIVNTGTLQTVTFTSGGVTQTHNQALYTGNRAVGKGLTGQGTSSDPILIYTAENFRNVPRFSGSHYRLMNNVDLQNVPWTTKPVFNGTFEGNNNTVSNMYMTFTNSLLVNNKTISYGLFAENRGTIRNLKITANINLLTNLPSNYTLPSNREIFVGTLAAANFGTIQNVTVSSSNSNPTINSTINVKNTTGGIVGENMAGGSITTSTNNGAVYSNGGTGGIIGHNRGSTSGCTNNALIRYTWVSENRGIGGIAGENTLGTVSSGNNYGTIFYANTNTSSNRSVQPFMAHIVGNSISGTVSGTYNFNGGIVDQGTLRTLTSPTFNQALYVGSRVVGK